MSTAEIQKLAKTLDVPTDRLEFLAGVPGDELRILRQQIAETLFRAGKPAFARVAALSKTVPVAVSAKLTEAALPPLLAARTAELLEPAKAAELVGRVSDRYLADVSACMDAGRAPDVVAAIAPAKVATVGAELARRGEWVVIGGFVSHVSDDALAASVAGYDGETLLHVAFVMDDLSRLDAVVGLLSDAQLDSIVAAAPARGLWRELVTLTEHLEAPRQARLAARYAAAEGSVRERYDAAVADGELTAAELDRLRRS